MSNARELFLESNTKARELQTATMAEFHRRFAALGDGLTPMLHSFVDKANAAREIGIVLCELADSLPGKRLTLDFYEQMKGEFVDSKGQQIRYELIDWFIRIAKQSKDAPIDNMKGALKCMQPLLLASGEEQFQLVSEPDNRRRIQPKDEWNRIVDWLDVPDLVDNWNKLKNNEAYFPNGHLREDIRQIFAQELSPKIRVIEELKRELGL